jgi:hypothetical protein
MKVLADFLKELARHDPAHQPVGLGSHDPFAHGHSPHPSVRSKTRSVATRGTNTAEPLSSHQAVAIPGLGALHKLAAESTDLLFEDMKVRTAKYAAWEY